MKMKIHDTVITQAQLDACIARMQLEPFRAAYIEQAAIDAGVPKTTGREFIASRVADRLIQKFRKAGSIKITATQPWTVWTWVKK